MVDAVGQHAKATRFCTLHERDGAFVLPNPWDAGSARILTSLGFEALATSSGALAVTLGRQDGRVSRDEALAHAAALVAASDTPVSADLENGYGERPDTVADTVHLAAGVGLVGCSIEDAANDDSRTIYELSHATERVAAAVSAARSLPFPFLVTARAENYLRGRSDLDDTIRRLQAFAAAGADVLYAPNLPDLATIRTVCQSVSRPVNVMVGAKGQCFPVAALAAAGVRRISLGPTLLRVAITALMSAVREIREQGTFGFGDAAMSFGGLDRMMAGGPAPAGRSGAKPTSGR